MEELVQRWTKTISGKKYIMCLARADADVKEYIELVKEERPDLTPQAESYSRHKFIQLCREERLLIVTYKGKVIAMRWYEPGPKDWGKNFTSKKYRGNRFFRDLVLFMMYKDQRAEWRFYMFEDNPTTESMHRTIKEIGKQCRLGYRLGEHSGGDTIFPILYSKIKKDPVSRKRPVFYKALTEQYGWTPSEESA